MDRTCYAVIMGRRPGIYKTWDEVLEQTKGFMGASFKKCRDKKEALSVLGIENDNENEIKNLEMRQAEILSQRLNLVSIYVDGSFDLEQSIYAYGIVVVEGDQIIYEESGAEQNVEISKAIGSLAAELKASMKALQYAVNNRKLNITIYYDNLMIWRLIEGSTPPKNKYMEQYIQFTKNLIKTHKIRVDFSKVKGHNGNKYNDRADKIAKTSLKEKRIEIRGYNSLEDLGSMKKAKVLGYFYDAIYTYKAYGCKFKTVRKRMDGILDNVIESLEAIGDPVDKEYLVNYVKHNEVQIKNKYNKFDGEKLKLQKEKATKKGSKIELILPVPKQIDVFTEFASPSREKLICWCHQFMFDLQKKGMNFDEAYVRLPEIVTNVVAKSEKEGILVTYDLVESFFEKNKRLIGRKYINLSTPKKNKEQPAISHKFSNSKRKDTANKEKENVVSMVSVKRIDDLDSVKKSIVYNAGYGVVYEYLNEGNTLILTADKKKFYIDCFSKRMVSKARWKQVNISEEVALEFYENHLEKIFNSIPQKKLQMINV